MAQIDIQYPVTVNIGLTTPTATPLSVNNNVLLSDNISVLPAGTIKSYTSLSGVISDYGTTAPETLAATEWFAPEATGTYFIISSLTVPQQISSVSVDTGGIISAVPTISFSGAGSGAAAFALCGTATYIIGTPGSGFLVGDTFSPTAGTYSTQNIGTVSHVQFASATLGDGGADYEAGEIITSAGGTFSDAARFQVLTVDGGGAVLTYSTLDTGIYTVSATTLTQGSTTGIGTGFELTSVLYGVQAATASTPGSYSVAAPNSNTPTILTGSGTGLVVTTMGWTVISITVTAGGNGYNDSTTIVFGSVTGILPTTTISYSGTQIPGVIADALTNAYNLSIQQGLGGFSWLSFATQTVSPAWGSPSNTISELTLINEAATALKVLWHATILTNDEDVLTPNTGNVASLIQAEQLKDHLTVLMIGTPTFASDPTISNKRFDTWINSLKANISLANFSTNYALTVVSRQTVAGSTTPVPVGQTDGYGITYTADYIQNMCSGFPNNLGQLNFYVAYGGNNTVFTPGFLLYQGQNYSIDSRSIQIFIQQYITQYLTDNYFSPNILPYSDASNLLIQSQILLLLQQFANAGMIQAGYTCSLPVIDFTTPVPRILGIYQITFTIDSVVYGVTINGVATV